MMIDRGASLIPPIHLAVAVTSNISPLARISEMEYFCMPYFVTSSWVLMTCAAAIAITSVTTVGTDITKPDLKVW